ncbi:hypothetical protein [Tsukamurella sp. NPDC003166]|uniref:hypothetical protein n=1 Tax=Tsukamurella sp. NPDC003166 TaxID=3154444 RepID=UPI0033AE94E0
MTLAAALAGERADAVWFAYTDYVTELLGEPVPWLDVDGVVAWHRRATGLIDSAVVEVDGAAVLATWIGAHPDLVSEMAERTRPTAPLRTLFADEGLRVLLADLVGSLKSALGGRSVALVLGAPESMAALAYRSAFDGVEPEWDEDDVDSAAVYTADLLRTLSESGLDALVIGESDSGEPLTADRVELYGPIHNVAAHYRWAFGLVARSVPADLPASRAPRFWVTGREVDGVATAVLIDEGFWDGDPPAERPARGVLLARVPARAQPERVLERVRVLTA